MKAAPPPRQSPNTATIEDANIYRVTRRDQNWKRMRKQRRFRITPANIARQLCSLGVRWRRHHEPPVKSCGGHVRCRSLLPTIKPEFRESAIEFSQKTAHFLAPECMLYRRTPTKRGDQVLWNETLSGKYEVSENSFLISVMKKAFRRSRSACPPASPPKHCSDFVLRCQKLFFQSQLTIHVSRR
ncbi:hypothetical protein [Azospirillum sp. BE72]|uniref:hypothetical protein n=1 Tax=Azospirillum sp. BE72 TaxID=2817776 RepID=UPI002861088A|nr:hypothetical protein [Azospirillum sp. BE72]MDR6772768.1 hypothetical protein [Azospirillum sp. BE72]